MIATQRTSVTRSRKASYYQSYRKIVLGGTVCKTNSRMSGALNVGQIEHYASSWTRLVQQSVIIGMYKF